MKIPRIDFLRPVGWTLLFALLGPLFAHAASVTTEIQGTITLTAPANTDTLVSPSFGQDAVWLGTATTASANQLTVAGSPNWTTNQFVKGVAQPEPFYARMLSGPLAGHYFAILANTSNVLTLDAAGLNLATIQPGEQLEIAAFWTLGTFYPPEQANTAFVPSASALVRQTELLFFDPAQTGINRSPSETFYFFNSAWRKVGAPVTTSYSDRVILPDTYFVHRNKGTATVLSPSGRVFAGKLSTVVNARSTAAQDNFTALSFPISVSLRDSGLVSSGAFNPSASPLVRTDQLLYFDPAQTGTNRSPTATFFYYNSGWRKVGAPITQDFSDSLTLSPGSGFIIRKAPAAASPTWTFDTKL